MHSTELKVSPLSDYFVYAPSALAQNLYLYPLSAGHFIYEPDYHISRNSFDSFLIMYIIKGKCDIVLENHSFSAHAGEFVFLNCYMPHRYGSYDSWEALWLHFDGILAQNFFHEIISHQGYVLSPHNSQKASQMLHKIYSFFKKADPIVESTISEYITVLLNELLIPKSNNRPCSLTPTIIADSISYINEHFAEPLSLDLLAHRANLSLYHFSRIFARETGLTPHQYLISTRISAARFMLKSSEAAIKDIAFSIGFNSESSFCSTFKKWEQITPSEYRNKITLSTSDGKSSN